MQGMPERKHLGGRRLSLRLKHRAGVGAYLDGTAGKKITLPALVLNAWDFRIYRKVR